MRPVKESVHEMGFYSYLFLTLYFGCHHNVSGSEKTKIKLFIIIRT